MNKLSQAFDYQRFRHNPRLDAITRDVENRYNKVILSDDDLADVSAAGDVTVPTMNPEIMLGRHALPDDAGERRI